MTMSIPVATMRLSREIPEAESEVESALVTLSSLMTSMLVARRETAAPAGTGHGALVHVLKAQEALLTASGELARAHGRMVKVGQEFCAGDIEECPPLSATLEKERRLVA